MRKQIIYSVLGIILLLGVAQAFDLIEAIPLRANHREEARIDGYWLLIENGTGSLTGYIIITEGKDGGEMLVDYGGYNIIGKRQNVRSYLKIDDVWRGEYGYHYHGLTEKFKYTNSEGDEKELSNVDVGGFYNPVNNQVYIRFQHEELDMTWVSYINNLSITIK